MGEGEKDRNTSVSKCLHGNSCAPAINQNFFFFLSILISVRCYTFHFLLPLHSLFSKKIVRGIPGRKEERKDPRPNALNSRNSIRYRPHRSFEQPDTMTNEGLEIYIYILRRGKERFLLSSAALLRGELGHKGLKG